MPIYDFECISCLGKEEHMLSLSEYDKTVKCSKCDSVMVRRTSAVPGYVKGTMNPVRRQGLKSKNLSGE